MNITRHNEDRRYEVLEQIKQTAIQEWPNNFQIRKDEMFDFIMANPDLPITYDKIVFLLRWSSPFVDPLRDDFFDVFARLVSEAKGLGDMTLVKSIYLAMPFYPTDKDRREKMNFYQSGIEYFLALGLHHSAGELYANLAVSECGSTKERIAFCEKALELLDQTSKEYACCRAVREILCQIGRRGNRDFYHYWSFGGTIFFKGESIFLSPIFACEALHKPAKGVCFDVVILKGYREWYETMDSLNVSGEVKEIADEAMTVGTSKYMSKEMEMIRRSDETVTCQADGKEYLCRVFTIRRVEKNGERIIGDTIETHYYVRGVGLIRTELLVTGRDHKREYVYNLCAYTIKGGDGMIPCCVGNQWYYSQEKCPASIDYVIKREIIAQNGEEYLLSGWNFAGENPSTSHNAL